MKKSLIKAIAFFIIIVSFIPMSAGCSSNSQVDKALSLLDSNYTEDMKDVTLTFYLQGVKKGYADDVLKEIEKSAYDKLKIHLDFEWIPELDMYGNVSYEKRICSRLSGIRNDFDAFYLFNYKHLPDFSFSEFAEKGYLKDISGMLQKYAPDIYGKLSPEQLKAATYDGKLYAVPNMVPKANVIYALVREDLKSKNGIGDIKTFEDYESYLKTIKENERSVIVPGLINTRENSMSLFAGFYDYSILDKGMQLVYNRDDKEMKILPWEETTEFNQSIKKMDGWMKNGYVQWVDSISDKGYDNTSLSDEKISDKLLSGYTASTLTYENTEASLNSKSLGSGKQFKAYRISSDDLFDRESPIDGCIAFNSKSNNVARALMFLNWIQSDQKNYDLLMYGREGIDYDLNGQNYTLPENVDSEDKSLYLGWQSRDAFMDMQFERYIKGTPEGYIMSYADFINSNTKYPFHTGFYPDFSDLSFETADRSFYLNMTMDLNIRKGIPPDSNVDSESMKSYSDSTDSIVKAIQLQLDTWKSK